MHDLRQICGVQVRWVQVNCHGVVACRSCNPLQYHPDSSASKGSLMWCLAASNIFQPVSDISRYIIEAFWSCKPSVNQRSLEIFQPDPAAPKPGAQDLLCKMTAGSAVTACKAWSATAELCPEAVVDQVIWPWFSELQWLTKCFALDPSWKSFLCVSWMLLTCPDMSDT